MEPINLYAILSLTKREVMRFLRVYNQTIFTPVVSALIFLAVFNLAIGGSKNDINGIKFINFMGYGIIIMSITQNAFANSSSSFIMSKVIGYIIDILMPPIGSVEIIIAFIAGSVLRAIMVGCSVAIALAFFIDYNIYHPFLLIYIILSSSIFLGQLGILTGILCNSFDQTSMITNYVITPLSFLSGTFYSVKNLHIFFQNINLVNPFFYIIDGFRYCFTDYADSNILFGAIFLLIANIILFNILLKILNSGHNLLN